MAPDHYWVYSHAASCTNAHIRLNEWISSIMILSKTYTTQNSGLDQPSLQPKLHFLLPAGIQSG